MYTAAASQAPTSCPSCLARRHQADVFAKTAHHWFSGSTHAHIYRPPPHGHAANAEERGRLPEELLTEGAGGTQRWDAARKSGAVRGRERRRANPRQAACKTLRARDGVTDELLCVLCGRLPALTRLNLGRPEYRSVRSLTCFHHNHAPSNISGMLIHA